jgi:hypothetical protein
MGSESLEPSTNDESSYRIIRIPAHQLPDKYEGYFFSKFLRSQKFQNPLFKLCDDRAFFENYPKYIRTLLARPNAIISFAIVLDPSIGDAIIGFSLTELNILHYVYVDKYQRRQGIAKALCNKPFDTITHVTNTGLTIFSKLKDVRLNPWA